ncbi:MAG: PLDc N-terminal domain-containing protein, partial [Odoribacter sp.]
MYWLEVTIYLLIALYVLTVVSVVFNVILENRNPVRTLAWIVVLVAIPLIGFLFYLYFGINYRKIKMFS